MKSRMDDLGLVDGFDLDDSFDLLSEEDDSIGTFSKRISKTHEMLDDLNVHIQKYEKAVYKHLAEVKELSHGYENKDRVSKVYKLLKKKFKKLKEGILVMKEENEKISKGLAKDFDPKISSELRMRENLVKTIVRKFVTYMTIFNEIRVSSQRKIDEHEETMQEVKEDIFGKSLLSQPQKQFISRVATKTRKTMEVEHQIARETNSELREMEADFNEILDMFRDMLLLADVQGDLVDSLEGHVESAANNVVKGTKKIRKSRKAKLSKFLGFKFW